MSTTVVVLAAALVPMLSVAPPAAAEVAEFERQVAFSAGPAAAAAAGDRDRHGHAHGDAWQLIDLRPGRRFDLVGFRRSGGALPDLQVRSYGARGWSRWTPVATDTDDRPDFGPLTSEGDRRRTSAPVWTGRSSGIQVRVRSVGRGRLTAHFVRISGGTEAGGGPRAAAVSRSAGVSSAETGGVSPGGNAPGGSGGSGGGTSTDDTPARGSDDAVSVPPAPPIVTREQWGAEKNCKPRVTPSYGEVLTTVVHHTVSTNAYSRAEAPRVVLGICRYHRNSNGWNDIGYNLLVDRFGTIYEGRGGGADRAVIGAHTQGYNGQTAGIALIGTYSAGKPSAAAVGSLRKALDWKLALAGITRNERVALISTGGELNRFKNGRTVFARPVSGHRDLGSTACPGNAAFPLLPGLTGSLKGSKRTATRMTSRVSKIADADGGESALIRGRLRAAGKPVPDTAIDVQAFDDTVGWVKIADARTDASGIWRATVRPTERSWVRGAFAGNGRLRPGRSPWLLTPKLSPPPVTGVKKRR